jgi:methyl halide transferase
MNNIFIKQHNTIRIECMALLDSHYWTERYKSSDTGWDLGEISPPLKAYIDQLDDPSLRILIPGCGSGYEGRYLWERGFRNIYFLDYSEEPLKGIRDAYPEIPYENFLIQDFFTLEDSFDLILEQTLFCALDPSLREDYARKAAQLLT